MANQLRYYTNNIYIKSSGIIENETYLNKYSIHQVRNIIFDNLVNLCKLFTSNTYTNIIFNENIIQNNNNNEYALNILSNNNYPFINFNNIRHGIVFFNEDGHSLSIIYNKNIINENEKKSKEEYESLKSLFNLGKNKNEEEDLINYNEINNEKYLEEIKKVFDLKNCIKNEEKANKDKDSILYKLDSLEEITKNYIFNSDNYIKLILILLKLRAKIPIILMGETGCGKTFLIKILSKLLYQKKLFENYKSKKQNKKINYDFLILNFHSGIGNNDIINWIKEKQLLKDKNNNNKNNNDLIYVFFDEINTCNSMSLINEILCKHTMNGEELKENITFIAACNPYRKKTEKETKKEIVGLIKEKKKSKNVYLVNPLPFTLLNFIYDFGYLKQEDEKKYIQNLIDLFINDLKKKKENIDDNLFRTVARIMEESIDFSQNFIRENLGVSSVSLREIKKFFIIFEYLIDFLPKLNEFNENLRFIKIYNIFLYKICIYVSIYYCYCLKIIYKEIQKNFKTKIIKEIKDINKNIIKYPEIYEDIFINQFKLENGIAKNQYLKKNLFITFICIMTKLPLFIVGKPGSSKSLSIKILSENLNGENSFNEFFKQFPKMICVYYQGSLNSTSEEIEQIFNKANKIISSEENIPVIHFDEIGLAEISPNNPLKVLHEKLEIDDEIIKSSFVGISNWELDASKMNRGIYINVPDPDENDLINTAKQISDSYGINKGENENKFFENIAKTYFNYQKNYNYDIPNFHGARDFYNLIKYCSQQIKDKNKKLENNELIEIAKKGIERNFGGLKNSILNFKKLFTNNYNNYDNYDNNDNKILLDYNKINLIEHIKNNISETNSRYLILIAKENINENLIKFILKKKKKENYFYLIGSNFENDVINEDYNMKIINKLKNSIENGNLIIIKNLDKLYPSLYYLFNQSYEIKGDNKYIKISYGSSYSKYYKLNEKFRVVILLN